MFKLTKQFYQAKEIHIHANELQNKIFIETTGEIPFKIDEVKLEFFIKIHEYDEFYYSNFKFIGIGLSEFKQNYFVEFKYDRFGNGNWVTLKIHFNSVKKNDY